MDGFGHLSLLHVSFGNAVCELSITRSILIEKCVILFARAVRNYLVAIINHLDNAQ